MASRIEDYALMGDCETVALVARDGSMEWWWLARFDCGACFAALLGTPEHGRWLLAPAVPVRNVRRYYRPETLILETEHETDSGVVTVIDWVHNQPVVIRRPEVLAFSSMPARTAPKTRSAV